jgi:hypothetical protein
MASNMKRIFGFIQRAALCAGAVILNGCSFDETPADIHQKLVPQIAQELVATQHSDRLKGLPAQATQILKEHAEKGIAFETGAPQMPSETGIRFYSKEGRRLFLVVGLNLNASQNGYIVSGISEEPKD